VGTNIPAKAELRFIRVSLQLLLKIQLM